MPAPRQVQAATLERFLDAWKSWNAEDWLGTFSDDFEQVTLPLQLSIPAKTRPEVEFILPKLMSVVTNFEMTVRDIVHDADNNKAAVYTVSKGDTPFGPWNLEYACFLRFDEAGEKVAKVEEMLDSAFMKEFGPQFGRYLHEQGVTHQ